MEIMDTNISMCNEGCLLPGQVKLHVLIELLIIAQKNQIECKEEHTTGWDLIENTKKWISELKEITNNKK